MKRRTEGITKINNLFEVYKKRLKAPQKTVIKEFIEVVHDLLSVTLKKEQCSYKTSTKTIGLNISGTIKSEILMRKKEILTHLKGRLGEKSAPENIL